MSVYECTPRLQLPRSGDSKSSRLEALDRAPSRRRRTNERTSERTKDGLGGRFGLRPLARRARTLEREFIVRRVVRPLVFVFRERRLGKPPPCCDGLVSLSLISSRETAGAAALYDYGSAFLCPECPEV